MKYSASSRTDLTYVFIRCNQDIVNQLPLLKFPSMNFMWLVIKCLVWIRRRKNGVLTCSKWGLQNRWIILFLPHHEVVKFFQKRREKSEQKHLGQCYKPPFNSLQKPLIYYTHEENAIGPLAIIPVRFYCDYHDYYLCTICYRGSPVVFLCSKEADCNSQFCLEMNPAKLKGLPFPIITLGSDAMLLCSIRAWSGRFKIK